MKSLTNQHWTSLSGEPITGRIPPTLRIMNGVEPTPPQMGEIAHHYKLMTLALKVSIIPYMVQERTLVDGTRIRMVSNYGTDTVMVWPVPQLPPFMAYPVYVGLDFLPVYDRAVIENGFIDPLYPPEPKFTEEPPKMPIGVDGHHMEVTDELFSNGLYLKPGRDPEDGDAYWVLGGTTRTVRIMQGQAVVHEWVGKRQSVVSMNKYGQLDLAYQRTDWAENLRPPHGRPLGTTAEVPNIVDGESIDSYVFVLISTPPEFGSAPHVKGGDILDHRGFLVAYGATVDIGIYEAIAGIINGYTSALEAYNADLQAYWERFREWERTVYQGWLDECFEIGLGTPSLGDYPIATLRKSGREKQSEAIRERLRGGVQDPHLAARFLSLPWNVRYKPKGAMPSTGTVVVDGPANAGAHDRRILFTLGGADRTTRVPPTPGENGVDIGVDIAQFRVDPEHPLSRDMAAPQCLFGWTASGSYERYAAYRPFHNTELPEVRGLSAISFGKASGYDELMKKGVEATDRRDAVITSDAFVPPGTELTMVFFEYEVWDRHTGEWIWAPHPDLTSVDAIWMKSPGQYSFPLPYELPDGEHSPRAVRIDAVTRQRRNKDMSWTTPVAMKFKEWEKEIGPSGERRPTAVAIVGGLPPIADPVPFPFGQTSFPFVETVLWTGQPARFAALMGLPWDDVGSPVHLTVAAVRAIKKSGT